MEKFSDAVWKAEKSLIFIKLEMCFQPCDVPLQKISASNSHLKTSKLQD